jgi:Uma2 family endonuclease
LIQELVTTPDAQVCIARHRQENDMSSASQREPQRMSIEKFRAFCAMRPDEEQWQLIDGVAIMMTPPTVAHQCISTNLQLLLYRALEQHAPMLTAFQRLGVNLAPSVEQYDPEPDVAVVDASASADPDRRYVDRFYLAAEIVSASDRSWVEKKREIYKLHETCTCILVVQQDRWEVCIDRRINHDWSEQVLTSPDDVLAIEEFGLRCKLSDIYRGTALQPRHTARR